jgi:hypothetical protein
MLPDIAETGRSQQCVSTCMSDNVGIAVPHQSTLALEHHAAKDQRSSRIIGKRVHVETLSDSYRHGFNLPEGIEEDRGDS